MNILDQEYLDLVLNDRPLPEQRLMYAILHRTTKDLFGNCNKARRCAVNFILKKSTKPYTFKWICLQLNLNHKTLINLFHKYKHNPTDNELATLLNGKQLINQHGFLESSLPKLSLF